MITERIHPTDVVASPFPHIAMTGALDDDLCRELIDSLPPLSKITKGQAVGNNQRFNLGAADILIDPDIPDVWKTFAKQHTSQAFLVELVSLFKTHIASEHPALAATVNSLRAGVRRLDDYESADILLDMQIGLNTPVTSPSSVRGPHLDDPRKLFAGLLYLRLEGDDSSGGDLQLLSPTEHYTLGAECSLPPERVHVEKTVAYQQNSLVLLLNTARSFHGVTPRSVTSFPRLFINLVAEMRKPIFDITTGARASLTQRLLQSFRRQTA